MNTLLNDIKEIIIYNFNMTSFTDIDEILQTPFLVKTVKIGMTIGNGIASVLNLSISMLLIILYTLVIEGGSIVFYLWDHNIIKGWSVIV